MTRMLVMEDSESSESCYSDYESSESEWECDFPRETSLCFTDAEPIDKNIYLTEISESLLRVKSNPELCELVTNYSKSIANMVELIGNGIRSIKHLKHPTKRLYESTTDFRHCYSDLIDELLRDQVEEIERFVKANK